jgi:CelD/BcsL family acetyltransferase involved in cellulose biosynthesis
MNPTDLFQCSDILKSLDAEMREGESERIVVWPKTNVSLSSSPSQNDLRYVESTCDPSSVLIDPSEVAGCDQQISTLEKHGLLRKDFHDRVKMITVKLAEQITELNDDLSINREVVQSLEEFQTVKEIWDRFEVDPLNSFSWNLSWWNAFQTHGDLHLIKFERAGVTVGLAPFYVDRWFGLSRLRFLATGDACTDYVDLICDPKHYELCTYSLAEYVREQKFDVVELECTRDDRLALLLKQHLGRNYSFDHRTVEPTWRLELPDSWEQFRTNAKKSLRRKINKAVRRLESNEFAISSTPQVPIEEAFEILKRLHTLRFESKGEPGVFADPQFESFLRSAVLGFDREGKCEIIIASQNGREIAVQLYFDSAEGFQLYQSGYDPDAMKLEPGHLLFTAMVRKAISRGDSCFDFLRGNEPYKEYWGALPHAQNKLRMVAKKVVPTIVATVVETGRNVLRRNHNFQN